MYPSLLPDILQMQQALYYPLAASVLHAHCEFSECWILVYLSSIIATYYCLVLHTYSRVAWLLSMLPQFRDRYVSGLGDPFLGGCLLHACILAAAATNCVNKRFLYVHVVHDAPRHVGYLASSIWPSGG
jgi:hypothetical protein